MGDDVKQTWTVGKLVQELSPGQVWAILAAIGTIVTGSFALGQRASSLGRVGEFPTVPCSQAKDWPKGVWLAWGHIDSDWKPSVAEPHFPQILESVVFDSPFSFEGQSDHPVSDANKNRYKATWANALQPDSVLNIDGGDDTGYKTHMTAKVTPDGCMINGSFTDSSGHRGRVHYLYQSDRYYVQR